MRLLFDSLDQPLPAAVRRTVGHIRRMRFALGEDVLEIESELESGNMHAVRGRLHAVDPALHVVEIIAGPERWSIAPDADGSFAVERLPAGSLRITVVGPSARHRLPAVEL